MEANSILTNIDFDNILWHDIKIYAIYYDDQKLKLHFDIDYISKWIENNDKSFSFEVSPATLIFINTYDIKININVNPGIYINDMNRINKKLHGVLDSDKSEFEWTWIIKNQWGGEISFQSTGFKLIIRKNSVVSKYQQLNLMDRGGISFLEF